MLGSYPLQTALTFLLASKKKKRKKKKKRVESKNLVGSAHSNVQNATDNHPSKAVLPILRFEFNLHIKNG